MNIVRAVLCVCVFPVLLFIATGCRGDVEVEVGNVEGLKYVISSPEEWLITPSDEFQFSYHITPDSTYFNVPDINPDSDIVPVNKIVVQIKGKSPDGIHEWVATKTIEKIKPNNEYIGILAPSSRPAPGFYICDAYINDVKVKNFNIASDLTEFNVDEDRQPDFADFWQNAMSDLNDIPIDAVMELNENLEDNYHRVYRFSIRSVGDKAEGEVRVQGWYREPKRNGKYPVFIEFEGYDNVNKPVSMTPNFKFNSPCVNIIFSPRGQRLNRLPPQENLYGKWVVFGLDSEHDYYYRGAYLDAARVVQFARSLNKADAGKIFVNGGSQGGALSLAAAALCGDDVAGAVVAFPFMGHFPLYLETARWPANDINSYRSLKDLSKEEILNTLSYFDTKNMATMVRCPVLLQMTLQDGICPPWTQFPIYSNLNQCKSKEYFIDKEAGHTGSKERGEMSYEFMNRIIDQLQEKD